MDVKTTAVPGWKRILIAVLIVADLVLLVVGIITIPPHFRKTVETAPSSLPAEGAALSTEERPDLEDFLWYVEGVLYDGIPAEAASIAELGAVTGGWKALIIYDPDNTHDSSAMELLNLNILGPADNVNLTLDWYLIFWLDESESFDETDMEDSTFTGIWENGGLLASGAGTLRLTDFYTQNGKQFAIGTMDTPDGIPAYVALVRP